MSIRKTEFGPEFTSLSVAEQRRIQKEIDFEWKARLYGSTFSRLHDKCAVVLYYVVFPIGVLFCFLERSPFRWPVSVTFIAVPIVWLLFPLLIQAFMIRRFFMVRAKTLAVAAVASSDVPG